jgi:hypothetical protein
MNMIMYSVYTIRVFRNIDCKDTHPSENSLSEYSYDYDYHIKNDFDTNYLKNELKLILDDIIKKHPKY